MIKNKLLLSFIIIWILFNLTSCNSDKKLNNVSIEDNSIKPIKVTNTEIIKNTGINKKLTINEKCIGCGRCARIAPNNFVMNFKIFKAEVISQKNIDSKEIQYSVDTCPTDSIHIG
ncbi:MAG: ferredoxin [Candidatus Gracilibacteria bacterium]